ncbi:DNA polymerase IV [Elusimicrobiota bacterium]
MSSTILHIDMNAFFASVEQQANPSLRGRPVAICGRGRTVVAAASYEARRVGVQAPMSLYEAKKCCPDLVAVEGNHMKYMDTSIRFHEICLKYTDQVEVFSIDEVFMDVTGALHIFKSGEIIAREIKNKIKEALGLTCSVGVAPGKLLAKLASEREKPDGLLVIEPCEVQGLLEETPVEHLCGIGSKTKKYLNRLGIRTLKQLGNTDISILVRHFGFLGNILKKMGNGEDFNKVEKYSSTPPVKSVGHSNTLPRDTWDAEVIRSFLLMLSERVGVRLRRYRMKGRTVSLHIRYSDFKGFSRQNTLSDHIKTGKDIYNTACGILNTLIPFKKAVRLVGVTISSLADDHGQIYLLESDLQQERITLAMDKINEKYGEFSLRPLSFEIANNFTQHSIDIPGRVHGFLTAKR